MDLYTSKVKKETFSEKSPFPFNVVQANPCRDYLNGQAVYEDGFGLRNFGKLQNIRLFISVFYTFFDIELRYFAHF